MDNFESMIRWQAYSRESRSTVNNHFLAYTAAILGLQISILNNSNQVLFPRLFIFTAILGILAFLFGSLVVLLRLSDSRTTARLARYRYQLKPQSKIDEMRSKAKTLSRWVNIFLPLQVISFAISGISILIWIFRTNLHKLI